MKPKKKCEIAPLGDKEKEDLIKTVSKYGYGIMDMEFSEVPKMDIHDVYMQLIELIHSIPENRLRTIEVDIDNDLYDATAYGGPTKQWAMSGQTITVVIRLGPHT